MSPSKNRTWPIARTLSVLSTLTTVVLLVWILFLNWQTFLEWKAQAGFWPFFLGLALLPLIGIPSTPLFLLAGAAFELQAALLGSAVAIWLNLVLSYWLARRWMGAPLARLLERWRFQPVATGTESGLSLLLLVRLAPGLPAAARNYAAALINVPFPVYLAVSWVTTALYAVGLIVLGDSLRNASLMEGSLAVALLLAAAAAAFWFVRFQKRRSGAAGGEPQDPS
jgi:uncharacterized membrane protein YdjX (TVP38/TMEM64 family)